MNTRSRVMAFNEKRDVALSKYKAQIEAYANKYMASFNGSESLNEWSSRHAARFGATINSYQPMTTIARDLANYVAKKKSVPATLTVTRYHLEHNNDWSEGQSMFNKFLLREFDEWYSAFEAEADEDSTDSADAASRWIYHSSKKLKASTGLSVASLVPVVEAWLNAHLNY